MVLCILYKDGVTPINPCRRKIYESNHSDDGGYIGSRFKCFRTRHDVETDNQYSHSLRMGFAYNGRCSRDYWSYRTQKTLSQQSRIGSLEHKSL